MTPRLRKFALTAHVTSSVGWLGTVAGFQGPRDRHGDEQAAGDRTRLLSGHVGDWLVRHRALLPRFADYRAFRLARHAVGFVPALLGPDKISDYRRGRPRPVRVHADPWFARRPSSRPDIVHGRARQPETVPCAPLRWWHAGVAGSYDPGGVQAVGHDSVRAACEASQKHSICECAGIPSCSCISIRW
jgi:hypothetical protein